MTFSTKISMSVSAAFLACFIVVAFAGYKSSAEMLETQIRRHLEDNAFNAVDKLDRMLHERHADTRILSTDPVLRSRTSTPEQITERLNRYKDEYRIYSSLSFFDLNRIRIADTAGKDIGRKHVLTEYWREILAGRDMVMKITESSTSRQVIIHFVVVVKDMQGKPFGVVAARMPVESIYEVVEESFQPSQNRQRTKMELLDTDGLILYSSYNKKGILKEKSGDLEFIRPAMASAKSVGSVRHAYASEDEISAFAVEQGYKSFAGSGWTLVICTPADVAFAPAYAQGRMFALMGSGFIVVVLAATFFVSRATVAPLNRLARAAKEIGGGNFEARVETSSKDEIGQLATAFNSMAADLAESEKRYKDLAEFLPQAVYELDDKGRITFANRQGLAMFGYTQEDIDRGMFVTQLFVQEDLARIRENLQKLIGGEKINSNEYTALRKDGGTFPVLSSTAPIVRDDKIVGLRGIGVDITERLKTEKILKENEEKLRVLTDTAQDAIVMMDDEGRISFWNRAAEEIFGYSHGEAVGQDLHSLIGPKRHYEAYRKGFEFFIKTGKGPAVGKTLVLDALRKGGECFPIELSLSALQMKGRWHAAGVIRDITERKKAEEVIQNHRMVTEKLNNALIALAKNDTIYKGDLRAAFNVITESSACAIDVCRASIWFYEEGNICIRCADLHDRKAGTHSEGMLLEARVYPGYFRAMKEEDLIVADDAITDPRTKEFAEAYLKPFGIASMLDVPIRISGKVVGVVCHEHVGAPREWTVEEQSFSTAVAGFVSAALEIAERIKAEESLKLSEEKIRKLKADVELRLDEAERINKLMVGRELKMEELRAEIKRLKSGQDKPERKG